MVVDRYRQIVLIALESVETSLSERDWNIHFSPGLLKPNFLSLWSFRADFVGKGRQACKSLFGTDRKSLAAIQWLPEESKIIQLIIDQSL